jgi:hypothetical protein
MTHPILPAQASDCATCEGHGEVSVQASDEPMTWQKRYDLGVSREAAMLAEISDWRERFAATPRATAYVERDAVLEEAAQLCESISSDWSERGEYEKCFASEYLAERIRAMEILATKGAKP